MKNTESVLFLTQRVIQQLTASLQLQPGREICGFLIGSTNNCGTIAEHWEPVRNLAGSEGWFSVDTANERHVTRIAKARGFDIIGFGHSHISAPPCFSEVDLITCAMRSYIWLLFADSRRGLQFSAVQVCNGEINQITVKNREHTEEAKVRSGN